MSVGLHRRGEARRAKQPSLVNSGSLKSMEEMSNPSVVCVARRCWCGVGMRPSITTVMMVGTSLHMGPIGPFCMDPDLGVVCNLHQRPKAVKR